MESPSPDEQRAIVEEWADAKPIERFHRFAVVVTPEGPLTLFGLLDQNGEHHRFYCDANVIPTLACEFYGLAMKSQECRAATQAEEVPPVILDFETAHYSVLSPRGHPKITGNAILALHTSSGFTIQTLFGPRALTELTIMLEDTLAQMPKPISIKKGGRTSERILGESTPKGEAVHILDKSIPPPSFRHLA